MFNIFKKKPKSILGIDIGTSSIKVVELKQEEDRFELKNYGELSIISYLEKLNEPFQTSSLKGLEAMTQEMLKILLERIETKTKNVVMAIPVFSSFTSVIEMPEMAEKELARAVEFEARRYVPISLAEVSLDWKIVEQGIIKDGVSSKAFKGRRIILIAVPKEVVNKYIRIAESLGLKLNALELESFGLARSLMAGDKESGCILDIGARATSFTIVDKGLVQMSHSLDVAGKEMTQSLATGLGIAAKRAEEFKLTYGLDHKAGKESRQEMKELLNVSLDKITSESERLINVYQSKTNQKIEKLILAGRSAHLGGLKEYIEGKLNVKTFIANPWTRVIFPPQLQSTLKKIGPNFSVAVGTAMRKS